MFMIPDKKEEILLDHSCREDAKQTDASTNENSKYFNFQVHQSL